MSMILKGTNGNEFELGLIRDVFPEAQDGFGDSCFVTMHFRAASQSSSFEENAPCVNLFEVTNLAEWLEAVAAEPGGSPEISEVELLEPELKFSVSQDSKDDVTIRISFQLPGRPEHFNVDAPTDEARFIDVHMSRPGVLAAAGALRTALEQVGANELKDDLFGAEDSGLLGTPDDDLNIVDSIQREPPGAGEGEDNAEAAEREEGERRSEGGRGKGER